MAKPGDFYLTALDFFGALIPGATTIGVALFASPGLRDTLTDAARSETAQIVAYAIGSYVVGQVSNSIGGLILDPLYDLFYRPGEGALSFEKESEGARRFFWRFLHAEYGAKARVERIERDLEAIEESARKAKPEHFAPRESVAAPSEAATSSATDRKKTRSMYQPVRQYLQQRAAAAFADLEKREADQKFFRALSVGSAMITTLALFSLAGRGHLENPQVVAGAAWAAAVALFWLFCQARRKTIDRGYAAFEARVFAGPKPAAKPRPAVSTGTGADEEEAED